MRCHRKVPPFHDNFGIDRAGANVHSIAIQKLVIFVIQCIVSICTEFSVKQIHSLIHLILIVPWEFIFLVICMHLALD